MSSAAVPEAGDMPHENLIRAETVPVRASSGWAGDPLAVRRLHKIAQHVSELRTGAADRLTVDTRKR
jgi:hypothetical protein